MIELLFIHERGGGEIWGVLSICLENNKGNFILIFLSNTKLILFTHYMNIFLCVVQNKKKLIYFVPEKPVVNFEFKHVGLYDGRCMCFCGDNELT